jgi:hypothetical protein
MKWKRDRGDDADSKGWLTCVTVVGDFGIEHCPRLTGDPKKPYLVTWWAGPRGDDVHIGSAPTQAAGKRMAATYIRELAAKLSEIAEPEPRYTLTEAGKAYRAAMTDVSLGGQVKAGEGE